MQMLSIAIMRLQIMMVVITRMPVMMLTMMPANLVRVDVFSLLPSSCLAISATEQT